MGRKRWYQLLHRQQGVFPCKFYLCSALQDTNRRNAGQESVESCAEGVDIGLCLPLTIFWRIVGGYRLLSNRGYLVNCIFSRNTKIDQHCSISGGRYKNVRRSNGTM